MNLIQTLFRITRSWNKYFPWPCCAVSVAQCGMVRVSQKVWTASVTPFRNLYCLWNMQKEVLRDLGKLHHFTVSTANCLACIYFNTRTKYRTFNNHLYNYCSLLWAGFHLHSYPKKTGVCTYTVKTNKEMYMLIQCFFLLPPLDCLP